MKKSWTVFITLVFIAIVVACSNNTGNVNDLSGHAGDEQHNNTNNEQNGHAEEPTESAEPTAESSELPEPSEEPTKLPEPSEEPTKSPVPEVSEPAATDEPTSPKEPAATSEPAAPKKYKIEIVDFAFKPEKLEIEAGSIVEFVNLDAVKHTATGNNDEFDTGLLAQDEGKEVAFAKAGEFGYYCQPHPGMKATIVVK